MLRNSRQTTNLPKPTTFHHDTHIHTHTPPLEVCTHIFKSTRNTDRKSLIFTHNISAIWLVLGIAIARLTWWSGLVGAAYGLKYPIRHYIQRDFEAENTLLHDKFNSALRRHVAAVHLGILPAFR